MCLYVCTAVISCTFYHAIPVNAHWMVCWLDNHIILHNRPSTPYLFGKFAIIVVCLVTAYQYHWYHQQPSSPSSASHPYIHVIQSVCTFASWYEASGAIIPERFLALTNICPRPWNDRTEYFTIQKFSENPCVNFHIGQVKNTLTLIQSSNIKKQWPLQLRGTQNIIGTGNRK